MDLRNTFVFSSIAELVREVLGGGLYDTAKLTIFMNETIPNTIRDIAIIIVIIICWCVLNRIISASHHDKQLYDELKKITNRLERIEMNSTNKKSLYQKRNNGQRKI
ncbi:MAG TPA: hypothetical protein VMG59_00940 [Phycisphaerae bacterium]|nr:hypothetical protein [Phycisphaerae bacterium]